MERDELIALIVAAFDGVDQPTHVTLHVAEPHAEYDDEHDDEHRQEDWIGRYQVLYSLNHHPHDERLAEYHRKRFSLFSPEQLRACALFVKFCAGDETGFAAAWFAQGIHDGYWRQYDRFPDGSAIG